MHTITLTDGDHTLAPPTTQTYIDLEEMGYDPWKGFTLDLLAPVVDDDEEGGRLGVFRVIRDHLTILLIDAEPDAGWTPEKVGKAMRLPLMSAYLTTLLELGAEAWADPKASSPDESST